MGRSCFFTGGRKTWGEGRVSTRAHVSPLSRSRPAVARPVVATTSHGPGWRETSVARRGCPTPRAIRTVSPRSVRARHRSMTPSTTALICRDCSAGSSGVNHNALPAHGAVRRSGAYLAQLSAAPPVRGQCGVSDRKRRRGLGKRPHGLDALPLGLGVGLLLNRRVSAETGDEAGGLLISLVLEHGDALAAARPQHFERRLDVRFPTERGDLGGGPAVAPGGVTRHR